MINWYRPQQTPGNIGCVLAAEYHGVTIYLDRDDEDRQKWSCDIHAPWGRHFTGFRSPNLVLAKMLAIQEIRASAKSIGGRAVFAAQFLRLTA